MFSKPLAFGLLALSCVTAAAGGAYLATRHNAAETVAVHPAETAAAPASAPASPSHPVAETEAAVGSAAPAATPEKPTEPEARPAAPAESVPAAGAPRRTPAPNAAPVKTASQGRRPESTRSASATPRRPLPPVEKSWPSRDGAAPAQTSDSQSGAASAPAATGTPATEPARPPDPQPEPPRAPQFEDLVLPVSSVIGLQIQTPLTTERAHVEDRVDARVARDVYVDGRVAIPAGSRVMGSVTFVNRGGKIKDTARLGIRFHTLVLADGTEVRLNTEPIYRDGESPSGDSAKKIGGGAVVGAVLGGILGGGKGAVIGGMAGAGGGTAAAMAGDRNAATFPSGTVVTARLSSPATIQVEKR